MNEEIKKSIEELREHGLSDSKILALIILAQDEFLDEVELDLLDIDEQELTSLVGEVSDIDLENSDEESSSKKLIAVLKKIYGMTADSKIQSFIAQYLEECVEQAKEAKVFFEKYANNDPETLKKIIEAQDDPDVEDVKNAINLANKI